MGNINKEELEDILSGIDWFENLPKYAEYIFDENGIRVANPISAEDAKSACLEGTELAQIQRHEKAIQLDLPCSDATVLKWAEGLGFVDALSESFLERVQKNDDIKLQAEQRETPTVDNDNVSKIKSSTAKEVFEHLKLLVKDPQKLETLLFKNSNKTKWLSECKLDGGYHLPKVIKAHAKKGLLKEGYQKQ